MSSSNTSSLLPADEIQAPVTNLLQVLRAPRPSDLARKRRVASNPVPPVGKRRKSRGSSSSSSEPKTETVQQRVREYPDEPFDKSSGMLFCKGCREQLSLKCSSLQNHMKSSKHKEGKLRLTTKEKRERNIAKALAIHNQKSHLVGETLPEEQQVFHVKVVTSFLRAAVPICKIDCFREIFEESAFHLTDGKNLFDLVPFIRQQEQTKLQEEIRGKNVSIIFDGTSRLGEALAIVVRYIKEDWQIKQCLICMQMLAKSLNGEELARELMSVFSVTFSIATTQLLACMRDRSSVNTAAMKTLKIVYPQLSNRYWLFLPHHRSCWRTLHNTKPIRVYKWLD